MDFDKLSRIIESGTKQELESFCTENSLYIEDGVVKAVNSVHASEMLEYWDRRQTVLKIQLNS